MSCWEFVLMGIGVGTVVGWLFRLVDVIEAPARNRARW